jgi:hypothetical protein
LETKRIEKNEKEKQQVSLSWGYIMSFQNYFIYKNVAYGVGTKVKIISTAQFSIIRTIGSKMKNTDEIKAQIYTFSGGTTEGKFYFLWQEIDNLFDMKHGARSQVELINLDKEILEIVEPVYVKLVSWQEKAISNMLNGETVTDIFGGVLIYIVVMAIGTIFQARLLIWLFSTVVFLWWLLNQYKA